MTESELLRRLDQTIARNSRVIALNEQSFRQLVASNGDLKRTVARLDAAVARLEAKIEDLGDQIRANTEALLRLIDRLGPEPSSSG